MKFWNIGQGEDRREKEIQQQVSYEGLKMIMAPIFSIGILGARRYWNNTVKISRENNFQLQILHPNYQSNERVELRFLKTFSCHVPFFRKILEKEIH